MFALNVILNFFNTCANLKKLVADSFFLFDDLFFIRKSIRINPTDNKILLQVLKKDKVLTKIFIEQSEHIKQLEKKIDKLINNIKKTNKGAIISLEEIIALQIAKSAIANKNTRPQTSLAALRLSSAKLVTGLQLIINFAQCIISIVNNLILDLWNHL